jgi:4-diphosphocytidyl-2-C-methyl-D-erythritol kinase
MEIFSPAKINLFLIITDKRTDGYHNLVSLMCAVGLYDTVSLEFGSQNTSIACSHPDVPEDETNLAYKAVQIFQNNYGVYDGVDIVIEKKIPVAAGLGGGSSNAAAVLSGLNIFYGYPFSLENLMTMGLAIGADVPFFLYNKPAIASGVGEKLEYYHGLQHLKAILIFPGFGVSTPQVYKSLNLRLTKCKKKLKQVLLNDLKFDPRYHLCNDLERVVTPRYPVISAAKEALLDLGAIGALMSGSGPTVFGLFSDADRANAAGLTLLKQNKWQFYLADMLV